MGCILGRGERQYLLEDDGTLWNMTKTMRFDRETFEPLIEPVTEVFTTGSVSEEPIQDFTCNICGIKAKSNAGLVAHKRLGHKGGT